MPEFDFDTLIDRRGTGSAKWEMFDEDVLPLWVADMDFRLPQAIIDALKHRADHGLFGYEFAAPELNTTIVERMKRLYDWDIEADWIVYMPGVIVGLSMACKAFGNRGGNVLIQTPVYPPFMTVPPAQGMRYTAADLTLVEHDNRLHYEIDFAAFERVAAAEDTDLFILCNPHNPVGRVWNADELRHMAQICLDNDVFIVSDEIHCDLLFDDNRHIPIASLSKEIEQRSITLMAASKSFNMPSLGAAFAIIADADLRRRYGETMWGIGAHAMTMGYAGTLAAYRNGGAWLDAALAYMQDNRDYAFDFIAEHMPQIKTTCPEGTYLMWLDCRALALDQEPGVFFREQARVALNEGKSFGESGQGFVRLNVACPRAMLTDGLERMRDAVQSLG